MRLAETKELAAKGWTQQMIAARTGVSQQQVSRDLAHLREEARTSLSNHYQRLAWHYELVIQNILSVRKEAWQTLANTSDARSKSVLYNTLLQANRELLEVLASGDLIEQEIANAELLAAQAKEEIKDVKRKIEEEIDPQAGGFGQENSVSTSSLSTAPQEAVYSRGAIALAMAEDSSRDTEEEKEEEEGYGDDSPHAPEDASSSTTAAATTIPTDTIDMMAYEVVCDDSSVGSTAVQEAKTVVEESTDRRILADLDSNSDSLKDPTDCLNGKGKNSKANDNNSDKVQKGDPDSKS
jgi:hypothetical protein